jgi:hypothetical protein
MLQRDAQRHPAYAAADDGHVTSTFRVGAVAKNAVVLGFLIQIHQPRPLAIRARRSLISHRFFLLLFVRIIIIITFSVFPSVRVWIHLSFLLPLLLLPLPSRLRNQNAFASTFRAREQRFQRIGRFIVVVIVAAFLVTTRRVRSHLVVVVLLPLVVVVIPRKTTLTDTFAAVPKSPTPAATYRQIPK